jgi:putative hydrolase of HD superfamily
MDSRNLWQAHDDKLREVACELQISETELKLRIQGVLSLGCLLITFSRITRDSRLDREGTHESDTDHTVTLAVLACAIAARCLPALDIGRVAQYALVHDLVEAYCGDTSTWPHEEVDLVAKKKVEEEALRRIREEFHYLPWVHETIERYEELADPEARFVKALDKAMPALLHNLNDGLLFEMDGLRDPADLEKRVRSRSLWLRRQGYARDEQDHARVEALVALTIRELLMERVIARQWEKYTERSQDTPDP